MENKDIYVEKLDSGLEILNLPNRTYNALTKGMGGSRIITSVRELLSLSYKDLCNTRNIGQKGLSELLTIVHSQGFKFDFEFEEKNISTKEDYIILYKEYLNEIKAREEYIISLQNQLLDQMNKLKEIEEKIEEFSNEDKKLNV